MGVKTQQSRVDALIRLVGAIVFALGAILAYLTRGEVLNADLVPQLAAVFYLLAVLLMFSGLVSMIAKFK